LMEDANSKTIGNYEVVETIRQAPEGTLYKAVETSTGNHVILIFYYPSLQWSNELLNEFFNLTGHLQFIDHPYLLPILDVGKHEGLPYVVFSGDSFTFLADRLGPQTDRKETLEFFYKIADALDYLHKQEILHGSINTETIVIDEYGDPKLFNHGLSGVFKKLLLENLEAGFENLSISNLNCTSPEQIQGRHPTRASDIYSFGIVFFFQVFGQYPFLGKFPQETALAHIDQRMLQIEKIPTGITSHGLTFIEKCIQYEPEGRFTSFAQIMDALERMKAGRRPRFQLKKRFVVKKSMPRVFPWLTGVVLLLAFLFTGLYLYSNSKPSQMAPTAMATTIQSTLTQQAIKPTQTNVPTLEVIQQPTQEIVEPTTILSRIAGQPAFEGEIPGLPIEKITLSNINGIKEFSRLGYGRFEDVDTLVSSGKRYFAFATSAGVFIFQDTQFIKWIDPQDWATSVQFSNKDDDPAQGDQFLAIGVQSGDIQMWDWKNGKRLYILPDPQDRINDPHSGHTGKITKLLFAKNGAQLYSASADNNIIVWDLKKRKNFHDKPIDAHSKPVNDLAASSDGRILISGSDDDLIRIWDINSGKKLHELPFERGNIKAVAISSDGQYLAVGGDQGIVQQWVIPSNYKITNKEKRNDQIVIKNRIWSLQYTRNNSNLLIGIYDTRNTDRYQTVDATQKKYEGVSSGFTIDPLPSNWADVFGADFNFDYFSLGFNENDVISITWDGEVALNKKVIIKPTFDNLDRLDLSPDGTVLATGGELGITSVWNLTTNQFLYKDRAILPYGDAIAPNDSTVAVIAPNTIHVSIAGVPVNEDIYRFISLANGQILRDLSSTVPGGIVNYAHDGKVFISANINEPKGWDFETGYESLFKTRTEKGCRITSSANNDELFQTYSKAGVFQTWDERAGIICQISSQTSNKKPSFSRDLNLIVFINSNDLLEGFDTVQNKSLWINPKDKINITALAVSPDGSIVAYGDETGKMTLINGRTGELLNQVAGNFGKLQAIVFSEDGTKIATAGSDGIARVFGIVELK